MTDVKQLPEAFLKEMEQLLGDEYEAYIKSYEEAWKPGLRVNTLKIMPEEFKNLSHLELTFNMNYFETTEGAESLEGLQVEETQAASGGGLANSDMSNLQRSDLETAAEAAFGE